MTLDWKTHYCVVRNYVVHRCSTYGRTSARWTRYGWLCLGDVSTFRWIMSTCEFIFLDFTYDLDYNTFMRVSSHQSSSMLLDRHVSCRHYSI